jgi:hypothetical protein
MRRPQLSRAFLRGAAAALGASQTAPAAGAAGQQQRPQRRPAVDRASTGAHRKAHPRRYRDLTALHLRNAHPCTTDPWSTGTPPVARLSGNRRLIPPRVPTIRVRAAHDQNARWIAEAGVSDQPELVGPRQLRRRIGARCDGCHACVRHQGHLPSGALLGERGARLPTM